MYEQNLRLFFKAARDEIPSFDVALLGMGADGHTASLFPGTEALAETKRLAVASSLPRSDVPRLTVTYPLLNAARAILVLVRGADKAARLAAVLEGEPGVYPIQRVAPIRGDMVWFVDDLAASRLSSRPAQGME